MSHIPSQLSVNARSYRVVDLRDSNATKDDVIVNDARSRQNAASRVLGMALVRSGKPRDLQARVYFRDGTDALTMVRLYRRIRDR